METKTTKVIRLIKKLKIAEELYKCVCLRAYEKPLSTFFRMMAQRKHFYHDEISSYLDLKIEKDYFTMDDHIVNDINEELEGLRVCLKQNDLESLIDYFIQEESSLVKEYKKIIMKGNYDFLTNLILFESQLADIEGCLDELKEMQSNYTEVEIN